jgi:hypothetical protein
MCANLGGSWEAIDLALSVAVLAGSPWGPIRPVGRPLKEGEGSLDGYSASAEIGGRSYRLTPDGADDRRPDGSLRLALSMDGVTLAIVRLEPCLAARPPSSRRCAGGMESSSCSHTREG